LRTEACGPKLDCLAIRISQHLGAFGGHFLGAGAAGRGGGAAGLGGGAGLAMTVGGGAGRAAGAAILGGGGADRTGGGAGRAICGRGGGGADRTGGAVGRITWDRGGGGTTDGFAAPAAGLVDETAGGGGPRLSRSSGFPVGWT